MTPDLDQHLAEAATAVAAAGDLDALRTVDSELLGKQSVVTEARKTLGGLDEDERKAVGRRLNEVRVEIEALVAARRSALEGEARAEQLEEERLDLTELDRGRRLGHRHVVTQTWERLEDLFVGMGYTVSEGPEIEDEWHNFGALNFPPDHPARDMYDTLYVDHGEPGSTLLRTHTSPVQIRTMRAQTPPIRVIIPGRTYRHDSDQTHTPMFHQVEGLVIDKAANIANLKWVLEEFCKAFFEVEGVKMRFRPSFFPSTEPSAEVDIQCSRKGGEIRFGEGDDWLEILGCGMVHPNVLRNCGLDPDAVQGFAFGVGIDRIAMLKYGMPDLRPFFEADVRWLDHYGFRPLDVPSLVGGLTG